MRRGAAVFCALTMLFLSACGADRDAELLSRITARYGAAARFTARTAVRVELTERTLDFVIDWRQAAGTGVLTVAEPEEIAGILSLEPGTVKSRIFRARRRLCAMLQREGNIPDRYASHGS